jgi:sensor histidine kinase regulating citrate/malate metabolism
MSVENSGRGLPDALLHCLNDRQNKPLRLGDSAGIGLWVICRLVEELHGRIEAENIDGGARISIEVPLGTGKVRNAA